MNVSEMVQQISCLMIAVGVMAFMVSVITQVVKSLPVLDRLPTAVVVLTLSMVLCPSTFLAVMAWQEHAVKWYMVFACIIAAFVVALVSMDGWERLKDIWERTGYKGGNSE